MAAARILGRNAIIKFENPLYVSVRKNQSDSSGGQSTRVVKKINLQFDDPKVAFKGRTTWELIRAYIVYQLLSIKPLVTHNMAVMKFSKRILGNFIFTKLMKMSMYGHFVAGENEEEITPVLQRMYSFGVFSILDYSVEEDISTEEAEDLTKKAMQDLKTELPQYKVDPKLLDRREKVVSARTYFYEGEHVCDRNMEIFLKCIECASKSTYKTGMSAIKLTALCRPKLLMQISEVITKSRLYMQELGTKQALPIIAQHVTPEEFIEKFNSNSEQAEKVEEFVKHITSDQEGIINLFPWSGLLNDEFDLNETFQVPDIKTGKMVRFMSQLTENEVGQFKNMIRRVNTVVRAARDLDLQLMIDAEQTYFQPAISRLSVELMRKYNTDKGTVYNTYQNYLVGSYQEIVSDLDQARRQNFYFRCKLVRGAYMDQERQRAKDLNYADPIHATYKATSENYDKVMTECLTRIKKLKDQGVAEKKVAILIASHNEESIRLALKKMDEIGIQPDDGTVMFGQLFGMCDFISYTLGDAGYPIYKYVPYGPVNDVLPYLSRRALENRGVLANVIKEKKMLRRVIFDRLKTFDLNRNPVGPLKPPTS